MVLTWNFTFFKVCVFFFALFCDGVLLLAAFLSQIWAGAIKYEDLLFRHPTNFLSAPPLEDEGEMVGLSLTG